MSKIRPRLTEKEYEILQQIRSNHAALQAECDEKGIPIEDVKHYWYKGENFSINVKNPTYTYEQVRDQIVESMKKHSPIYEKIKRDKPKDDGHLLVIDPADVHIGKLATSSETGEDYNSSIAVHRVLDGVYGIIEKSKGFKIDKILYIIGNDILHTDTPRRTTTSGTHQDTDGMWYENFMTAKRLNVAILETLMKYADVYVQYDPSNHDYMSGYFLADTISSWFSKSKNIQFNCSIAHRKYFRYYNNLIGTTHGDGAKEQDLPLLMAHESQDWTSCKHKYFYTHHIHHKKSKDYMGVTIESVRSPSGPDGWHSRNGYQHAPKAIEAFIHSKENGQVARISHIFD